MKLATFRTAASAPLLGLVDAQRQRVLDCQALQLRLHGQPEPALASMLALMEAGPRGLGLVAALSARLDEVGPEIHGFPEVRWLAPVPVPAQARDYSVFERHIIDAPKGGARLRARLSGGSEEQMVASTPPPAQAYYERPMSYFTNRFNFIGHDEIVEWPANCENLDFELEIGMYLGKGGKNISRERAGEHIFGYTIFNDVSARDVQVWEMAARLGPGKGKSMDSTNVAGPWIVTPDEMPDLRSLQVRVLVNGQEWHGATTSDMLHGFEDMIAWASTAETLHVGEFFGSGCVGGCSGMELDRWVKTGDVVELVVPGIGTLRNRYAAPN